MNDFTDPDQRDPNKLDTELAAMFEQRLEHNRQTIAAGPIQREIAERTRRRFGHWVMPSLLAVGATAAIIAAVVMSGDDATTTVELPPVDTPAPTVSVPGTDFTPVASMLLSIDEAGRVTQQLNADQTTVLWEPPFEPDRPFGATSAARPGLNEFWAPEAVWFVLRPAIADDPVGVADGCLGTLFRFDYATQDVVVLGPASTVMGSSAQETIVAAVLPAPDAPDDCERLNLTLLQHQTGATGAWLIAADDPSLIPPEFGADRSWTTTNALVDFSADGSRLAAWIGAPGIAMFDVTDPEAPRRVLLDHPQQYLDFRTDGPLAETRPEFDEDGNITAWLTMIGATDAGPDEGGGEIQVYWSPDGEFLGGIIPTDNPAQVAPTDLVVGNGMIGDLRLPATEAQIRAAFPEADGWTYAPDTPTGVQMPDQPPASGLGVAFGTEPYFIFEVDAEGQANFAWVQSPNVRTTGGEAVGETLQTISLRHGRLIVALHEFAGEAVGYSGIDVATTLYAEGPGRVALFPGGGGADGDGSDVWDSAAGLSRILVGDVASAQTPFPPVDTVFIADPCLEAAVPQFDEAPVDDMDFDGQPDRIVDRKCGAGADQLPETFLQLSSRTSNLTLIDAEVTAWSASGGVLTVETAGSADATRYIWTGSALVALPDGADEATPPSQLAFQTLGQRDEDPETVIARVRAELGEPTGDSGWREDQICFGQTRWVSWGNLGLLFSDSEQENYRGFTGASYAGPVPGIELPAEIGQTYSQLAARHGANLQPIQYQLPFGNYAAFEPASEFAGVVMIFDEATDQAVRSGLWGDTCSD